MGFMSVLKFSAACFDFLGWPLFALGYPLCASIWVIETNSISDIRKLVSYWIIFSLISLFDHAFCWLLEWVPLWPYLKLMFICSLVIPNFDGSYYVYQHLVQPCLSFDPQVFMNWFLNEPRRSINGRENFLIAADRYVKENGAEALEKFLSSKVKITKIKATAAPEIKAEEWKCEDTTVAQKEIEVVQPTQIKFGQDVATRYEAPNAATKDIKVAEVTQRTFDAAAPWVNRTETSLGETRRDATCAAGIKERKTAVAAAEIEACRDHRTPEILLQKEVQKQWACAMCLVTTHSEVTFNSHLQGQRHKAASELLNAKKNATPAASPAKKPNDTKDNKQRKCTSSNGSNQENNKKQKEKARVSETNEHGHQKNLTSSNEPKELVPRCNICNVTCTGEHDLASHLNGKKHLNKIMQLSQLWCITCNINCQSEVNMTSHKNGKQHLEQLKERSGLWCGICSLSCSSEENMNSHLNGKRHLKQIEEQLKLWCSACSVLCKSQCSMASHLKGKRHLEKMSNST